MAHRMGIANLPYQQKLWMLGEGWLRGRRAAGRLLVAALVGCEEEETANGR